MRAVVLARASDLSQSAAPLSEAVPRFVDIVARGNRVGRFVRIKACTTRAVSGMMQWAKLALRVIARAAGGPRMLGHRCEAACWNLTRATGGCPAARVPARPLSVHRPGLGFPA
eukprot:9272660-Alexandrium_andersonii.AAC.1